MTLLTAVASGLWALLACMHVGPRSRGGARSASERLRTRRPWVSADEGPRGRQRGASGLLEGIRRPRRPRTMPPEGLRSLRRCASAVDGRPTGQVLPLGQKCNLSATVAGGPRGSGRSGVHGPPEHRCSLAPVRAQARRRARSCTSAQLAGLDGHYPRRDIAAEGGSRWFRYTGTTQVWYDVRVDRMLP